MIRCDVESTEEEGDAYKVLVGTSVGNKPVGKPKFMWDDNVKMVLQDIRGSGVAWIYLAQNMGH